MSAVLKEEVKQNNLMEGTTSPTQVEVGMGAEEEEEDPDAIDETVSNDQPFHKLIELSILEG